MVGERVSQHPGIAREVLEAGHEVQLHCHRHIRHSEMSEPEIERDTRVALEAFGQIGVSPSYWRTPWGVRTAASREVARRHRLRLVNWTIDTHDWRGDPAPVMLAHANAHMEDGDVVLMHDGLGPGAVRAGCRNTVELLAPLVASARQRGFLVGPLSEETLDTETNAVKSFATFARTLLNQVS
jgi:peptidoglycan/xylan/chitin deacetylase (PgdA/CDA1 family)